jgi:Carboxypeptidase regulatory-like domain
MNSLLRISRARKRTCVLGAIVGVLLFSVALFSQGNFGRILGTVTDQSGGVVSGATVTIIDKDRGVARTLTTDGAGEYNAPTLIPGTYTVRVELKGFRTIERQNVLLEVGKEVRVDLTVQPGEQTQSVTVTEAIPLVETTNATLGGTLENTQINDMPLNGRNYQNLMTLRPGVMVQPGGSPWSQSTNDLRPDASVWMMDGVLNVSQYDNRQIGNMPSAFTDAATIVPIDAIQEFNLEENPKAEFGWNPGAVVNVGIKSGTNTLHGSGYAFGRYEGWDARNTFNPGLDPTGTCAPNPAVSTVCDQLPSQLKQFGAVVGGPIRKDKLFFFAGYEGLRSLIGNIFAVQIPETAGQATPDPKNSMVDAINAVASSGGGFNTALLSQPSLKLLGCTVGASASATSCTGGLLAGATANSTGFTSTFPNSNVSDNGIAKIDYVINSKHRVNGTLWTGNYNATGQDHAVTNALFESGIYIRTWTVVGNWIWTPSSTVVNEFRFGYDRATQGFTVADQNMVADGSGGLCNAGGCGGTHYPLDTGAKSALSTILVSGFVSGGSFLGNPNGTRPGATGPSPYFDFQDNLSYLRGKHSLKFGGEITHIEADQFTQDFRGIQILFNGGGNPALADCGGTSCPLEDFFAGIPTNGINNTGNGVRVMKWMHFAGFIQDDWRIKPKLMLNLGLRYEYAQPIKEVNNLYGNFDPNSPFGIVQQGEPGVGPTLWKPNRHDFSPRVGFAWDVTGKGTTVVRGGASVIYESIFARPFMDNAPPNNSGGNIAEDPSGACSVSLTPGQTCASAGGHTFGGTIDLGQPTYTPPALNWNGVVFPQGGLSCTATSQCSLFAVSPNLKTPYVVNYNVNVQHSITNNLSLEVGYVGNHGARLQGISDINQCAPNQNPDLCNPTSGLPFTDRLYGVKFPYLGIINFVDNFDRSNYNSLQTTLTQRISHGLEFTAGYTYGHGLDDGSLNFNGLPPQNSQNRGAEYASSDFDVRHRFTITASYAIPGKKGYAQLLEGWKLNTIVTLQTSQPWLVFDTGDDFSTGGSGFGDRTDRWDFFGNPNDFRSSSSSIPFCTGFGVTPTGGVDTSGVGCSSTSGISTLVTTLPSSLGAKCAAVAPDPTTLAKTGCYVSGNSVMTPPINGTFGTMGRNIFRDSGFKNVDFSVFKDFRFKERLGAQFRVEFFNLFNHPIIANPFGSSNTSFLGSDPSNSGHFGCGCSTPDVAAGNPLVGSGSSRVLQLGLKLSF